MGADIRTITNANVYIGGETQLGRVKEVELPTIKTKNISQNALGMMAEVELPSGFEKMNATFTWQSFYREAMVGVADPFVATSVEIRFSVEKWNSQVGRAEQVPGSVWMSGAFEELPAGTFKANDNAEFKSSFKCYAMRIVIDGQAIVEIDALANIYKVNDVAIQSTFAQNLGL